MTLAPDGTGSCRIPNGVLCLRCGKVFASQSELQSYELHRRFCEADNFDLSYDSMQVTLFARWKPFSAVRGLVRATGLKADLNALATIHTWLTDDLSEGWISLFQKSRETDLIRALLSTESEILNGLRKMADSPR